VLALAGRLTGLATVRGSFKRAARNAVFSVINRITPAKQQMMLNLSGLGRKDRAQLPPLASARQMASRNMIDPSRPPVSRAAS